MRTYTTHYLYVSFVSTQHIMLGAWVPMSLKTSRMIARDDNVMCDLNLGVLKGGREIREEVRTSALCDSTQ